MQAGDLVRLIDNPSRIGTLTSHRSGNPPRERLLINFNDGRRESHLISALEVVKGNGYIEDANELILKGLYGRAMDLRGAITHHRLSGKLANLIYSLNTTNTDFLPYQFKPVLHFLDSPSNGILIADEVGLGKTIEAGLIWTELRARQDAKRLLVVCPAMLKPKWVAELLNRFGVKAEEVDAGTLLNRLIEAKENPSSGFALVASIQGLRTPRGWDSDTDIPKSAAAKLSNFLFEMEAESPIIDLVIIDEAHYLRNELTQTNKFAKLLRAVTQNLVLLSATPIQTSSKDLFNLLNLLDEDAFPYQSSYEWNINANAPIVALRDEILRGTTVTPEKFALVMKNAKRKFDQSQQINYLYENLPTQEELTDPRSRAELADVLDRINPLSKVISRTLKRDVQELRVERVVKLLTVYLTPIERFYYDQITNAVIERCELDETSSGFLLTYPQRQMSSCMVAAYRSWKEKLERTITSAKIYNFEEYIEESGFEDALEDLNDQLPDELALSGLMKTLIQISYSAGNDASLYKSDSKYSVLFNNLKKYWLKHPNKKVILFSFYRNTLYYIRERLSNSGIESIVLHGGMDKQEIIKRFESSIGPQILLSSEVAAEGVDLQFASLLINYDLPWNPAKIEQRIGRIDRIGQKEERILIWNLVIDNTIDSRVYELLFQRLNIFQHALGSMEVVLGDIVKKLTMDLLSHKLSPLEQEARISNAAIVIERQDIEQKRLEREATHLIAHGDFIQNKVRTAASIGRYLQGSDLFAYINDYLRKTFPGTDFLAKEADNSKFIVNLSVECRIKFEEFLERRRMQGQTRLLATPPPILWFENKQGNSPLGIEKITQDHVLVRFVGEHQRATLSASIYHPAVAVSLAADLLKNIPIGIYVFIVMRWMFSGSRDSERLEYQVVNLDSGNVFEGDTAENFVNLAAMQGSDWLGATAAFDSRQIAVIQDNCRAELEEKFYEYRDAYKREDFDRIHLMIKMLESHLEQKRRKVNENIENIKYMTDKKKLRLIPMWEGSLKKLTVSIETRIAQLKNKQKLDSDQTIVSSGVIRLI